MKKLTVVPEAEQLRSKAKVIEQSAIADQMKTCKACGRSGKIGSLFGVRPVKLADGTFTITSQSRCNACRHIKVGNKGPKTVKLEAFTRTMRDAIAEHPHLLITYERLWRDAQEIVPKAKDPH